MVSQSDLLGKESHQKRRKLPFGWVRSRARRKADAMTAAQLMTTPAVTVSPTASLAEAARDMVRHEVTHLPVVDDSDSLVGIVARSDLLSSFLVDDREIRHVVEHDIFEQEMWLNPQLFTIGVREGVVTLSGQVERKSLVPIVENRPPRSTASSV